MSDESKDESLGVEQLPQDELEATPDKTPEQAPDEVVNSAVDTKNAESSTPSPAS